MVRQVNYSNEPQNRAACSISAAMYERRALDCTSPMPLIYSLNNLAYLVANNRKIRDLLCVDGGLERLIAILRDVPKSQDPNGKPYYKMWKWSIAFQCMVHMCIRGGVNVRERAVEAGIVPILVKILESYLCFSDAMRADRKKIAQAQAQALAADDPAEAARLERHIARARVREVDRRARAVEEEANRLRDSQIALEQQRDANAANAADQATPLASQPSLSASHPSNRPHEQHTTTRGATTTTTSTSGSSFVTSVSPSQAINQPSTSARPASFQQDSHASAADSELAQNRLETLTRSWLGDRTAVPSRPSTSTIAEEVSDASEASHSRASGSRESSEDPRASVDLNDDSEDDRTGPSGRRNTINARMAASARAPWATTQPAGDQPNAPAAPPTLSMQLRRNTTVRPSPPGSESWSGSQAGEDAEMSGDNDDGEAEDSEADASATERDTYDQMGGLDSDNRRTPRASRRPLASMSITQGQQPRHRHERRDTVTAANHNAANIATATSGGLQGSSEAGASEQDGPRDTHAQDASSSHHHHGRDRHGTVTGRGRPVLPTTYIAETFDPNDMRFRDEEVLNSLQILAYLTKYSHIRALLRFPKMTRASNLLNLDQLWEEAQTSEGTPLWKPGEQFHRSIYTIAERYTCRATRRDPNAEYIAGSSRYAHLIQYWAGVVMRNACRKDDRQDDPRAGLRQCGNMLCGRWEKEPREFAKCRRCKKAKFCSKMCQSTSWQIGHKYWCSSIAEESENRHRGQHTALEEDAAVQAAAQAAAEHTAAQPAVPATDVTAPVDGTPLQPGQTLIQVAGNTEVEQPEQGPTHLPSVLTTATPRPSTRRLTTTRRPSTLAASAGSSRIASDATSMAPSDVSEDETDRPAGHGLVSDNDMSEREGAVVRHGLINPAPMRTDLAGRPLPPPVIAGTGMELNGAQRLLGGEGDDSFGGRLTPGMDEQFARGDIDQVTWRGQTPVPGGPIGHERSDPHSFLSRSDLMPGQTDSLGHSEADIHRTPLTSNIPLAEEQENRNILHAPIPQSSRRFSRGSQAGEGSERGSQQPQQQRLQPSSPMGSVAGSPMTARRSASNFIPTSSSMEDMDSSSDALRSHGHHHHQQHHPQMNHHQHLLMRGGIAAGLMGRSATPTSYAFGMPSSHLAGPLPGQLGPSASARSSPTAGNHDVDIDLSSGMMDDEPTPQVERRNPFAAPSGSSATLRGGQGSSSHAASFASSSSSRTQGIKREDAEEASWSDGNGDATMGMETKREREGERKRERATSESELEGESKRDVEMDVA